MKPEKKRRGDRKDGWRIRSLNPFYQFTPFIMKTRNDASNLFEDFLDVTEADKYIRSKRAEGYTGFGMMHVIIAAYLRTVSQRPWINRFVSGQRVYARNNVEVCLTVKKELSSDAEESTVKVKFTPADTALDVYYKINEEVNKYRAEDGSENNATLRVATKLMKLPRPILRLAVRFLDWMDYHGWLPQSLLDASPFHGSMFITNLGSLGIPPVYHHLYNFGNIPIFIAFGAKNTVTELQEDGTVKEHKAIKYTVVSDERVCDGYYFARSFKQFKQYLRKPNVLDVPPEQVVEDEC